LTLDHLGRRRPLGDDGRDEAGQGLVDEDEVGAPATDRRHDGGGIFLEPGGRVGDGKVDGDGSSRAADAQRREGLPALSQSSNSTRETPSRFTVRITAA
jgi:hypothetical protein